MYIMWPLFILEASLIFVYFIGSTVSSLNKINGDIPGHFIAQVVPQNRASF